MDSVASAPDTITITEYHFLDVKSDGADIECTVSASVAQRPHPAIIKRLRMSLHEVGLAESALSVSNLRNDNDVFGCVTAIVVAAAIIFAAAYGNGQDAGRIFAASFAAASIIVALAWKFARRSTCSFKIRCGDNEAVTRVHKLLVNKFDKVAVQSTSWRYEIPSENLADWAEQCIERANARAKRVAKALGVEIIGVHSYEEKHELPQRHYSSAAAPPGAPAMARVQRAAAGGGVGPGESTLLSPGGESRAGAHVRVEYRVANYKPADVAPTSTAG